MAHQKHWTKFLPDAGRIITSKGDDQEYLRDRITRLERELSRLQLEYNAQEDFIMAEVREDWTIEEITAAKQKSKG